MSPHRSAAPEPASAVEVFDLDDPTQVGETLEVVDQDTLQLESSPLRVHRVVVRLDTCVVAYQSTNRRVRTRTSTRGGVSAVITFGPRSSGTVNGLAIDADHLVVASAGAELEFVVAPGYESVAFLLPPDDLRGEVERRARDAELRLPATGVEVLATGPGARALFDFARRLVSVASQQPAVFEGRRTRAAARSDALEALVEALCAAETGEVPRPDPTRQAHRLAVQLAEQYALDHAADEVQVSDLCAAAGVSERTLQYAFKALMGMSPVAYLNRLRLHRVRHALRTAPRGSTSVTREALQWGFWHLGDFSRSYKACFGESPSETLRRGRDRGAPQAE